MNNELIIKGKKAKELLTHFHLHLLMKKIMDY